jgi:hypothetical protein
MNDLIDEFWRIIIEVLDVVGSERQTGQDHFFNDFALILLEDLIEIINTEICN